MKNFLNVRSSLVLLVAIFVCFAMRATVTADGFASRAYLTSQPTPVGSLVSLSSNPDVVEPSTMANSTNLIGVVINKQSTYVADDPNAATPVQTSGVAQALVSTLNGDIKVDDQISPSSISGVGAKSAKSGKVLGVAQASLSQSTPGVQKMSATDSSGKKRTVYVARIPVLINITNVQAPTTGSAGTPQPLAWLHQLAQGIVGKEVNTAALVASLIIAVLAVTLAGLMLYAGIMGAMRSVGRNPLAARLVTHNLIRVTAIAIFSLAIGVSIAYFILLIA